VAQEELLGQWLGTYTCLQGETGVVLRVERKEDGTTSALFHFWPLATNPNAAEGCFELRQNIAKDGPAPLSLVAIRWVLRPPNYVMVDLLGRVDPSGEEFTGVIVGPNCTRFTMRRGAGGPPLPPPCRPSRGALVS